MTWIQTLGGRKFSLVNPRPSDVCFEMIAAVLSRVPRFGAHTESDILSVAQHCLEGAKAIRRDPLASVFPDRYALASAAFLLHDAHEAYIGDRATPVADAHAEMASEIGFADGASIVKISWHRLKDRLDTAIFAAAGISWPLSSEVADVVHDYDLRMCRTERDARLGTPPEAWADAIERAEPVKGCDLRRRNEDTVREQYLRELLTIRSLADSVSRDGEKR